MRLLRLKINDSKNLKNLDVSFDGKSPCTVLVGCNGSGKSNLFEALAEIFVSLQEGQPTSFQYDLEYSCRNRIVEINCDPNRVKNRIEVRVSQCGTNHTREKISLERFRKEDDPDRRFLPDFVGGYYSGECGRFRTAFAEYQKKYSEHLRKLSEAANVPRRFLYGEISFAKLIVVALFAHTLRESENSVILRELNIKRVDNVCFTLIPPSWYHPDIHPPKSMGLTGVLREFVAEVDYSGTSEGLARTGSSPRMSYRFSDNGLAKLAAFALKRDTNLFSLLLEAEQTGILKDFSCSLILKSGFEIQVDDLSEGEKQLLLVMGIVKFSQHDEALFLLDEPDTHLNPAWSVKYLETLLEAANTKGSHILLATHDPLVVSGLQRSQVRIMSRQSITGAISATEPDFDMIGMGSSAILKSELYGLRSDLDSNTLKKLDQRAKLYGKGSDRTPAEERKLVQLSTELASLGFAHEFRDPQYQQFMSAMARRLQISGKQILTEDEIGRIEETADSVLDDILQDSGT